MCLADLILLGFFPSSLGMIFFALFAVIVIRNELIGDSRSIINKI